MTPLHLITGIAGQDGVLLARLLHAQGHRVIGTVLPGSASPLLGYLADPGIEILEHDVRDVDAFGALVASHRPSAVHNLAALSSVGASWDDAEATRAVNQEAVEAMLAVLVSLGAAAPAFVQASSSEILGPAGGPGSVVGAQTPLAPVSPYAEAKAGAHRAVVAARDSGLHATNLVLFGHTSALHADTFVLPEIARQAAEVAAGERGRITLRNPAVRRDWGAARDFVRAFALAPGAPAGDFVIGTGRLHQLGEIAGWALAAAGLEPAGMGATESGEPARRNDFDGLVAEGVHAAGELGWRPEVPLRSEIEQMVRIARLRLETGVDQDPAYLEKMSA